MKYFLTVSAIFLVLCFNAEARSRRSRCVRRPIETSRESGVGDGGFRIRIIGDPETYRPEQVYMISLESTVPNQKIANFQLISARQRDPFNENENLGRFMYAQSLTIDRSFLPPGCSHIFGGRLYNRRSAVVVSWRAPPAGSGCVEFRALVSEFADVWYKDAGGLTKVICEDTDDPLMKIPKCCACGVAKYQMTFEGYWSRETHPTDFPSGPNEGLLHWSNIAGASHDKGLTIWRVGEKASRGVQHVCELGDTALLEREMRRKGEYIRSIIRAPGIWSRNLRQNRYARFSVNASHHLISLLTMIGPSPDWCVGLSAINMCQQNCTWARRVVFDLLPWDAGTDSGLTYTSDNVKTKPQGTIRYLSNSWPNDPASPFFGPDPIPPFARITLDRTSPGPGEDTKCVPDDGADEKSLADSRDSSCVTSPWSDWGPCSTTCGVGMRVRNRMLKSALGGCSHIATMDKEPCLGTENFCADGKPATNAPPEQEAFGREASYPEIKPPSSEYNQMKHTCEFTDWSEWSPCSATCGKGLRRRTRRLRNPSMAHLCAGAAGAKGRQTEETQQCSNRQFPNCSSVRQLINYSEICKLPAVRGPCTGNFPRWYYDPRMNRCVAFSYGGCRGNQNRFFSRAQCAQLCSEKGLPTINPRENDNIDEKGNLVAQNKAKDSYIVDNDKLAEEGNTLGDVQLPGYLPSQPDDLDEIEKSLNENNEDIYVDCEVTQWTSWSSCSATCGRGSEVRQRHVLTPPSGGGKRCPFKLVQRRNCRNSYRPHCEKEPIHCNLGGWSEWSQCSAGCLPDTTKAKKKRKRLPFRKRVRQVISRARYGGRPCPLRGERTQKQICAWLPVCPPGSGRPKGLASFV